MSGVCDLYETVVTDFHVSQTFIPQDATLFSGTLRENLDPFRTFHSPSNIYSI